MNVGSHGANGLDGNTRSIIRSWKSGRLRSESRNRTGQAPSAEPDRPNRTGQAPSIGIDRGNEVPGATWRVQARPHNRNWRRGLSLAKGIFLPQASLLAQAKVPGQSFPMMSLDPTREGRRCFLHPRPIG